jgi:hypothetical protein
MQPIGTKELIPMVSIRKPHYEPYLKLASYGGICLMDNLGLNNDIYGT